MSAGERGGLWWDDADAVPVDANAIVRGGELVGAASLTLLDDRLMLVAAGAGVAQRRTGALGVLELPYAHLDGARVRADGVTLFLPGDDLVELAPADEGSGGRLAGAGAELVARACRLPELTLSLRALGSRGAGVEHDEFFGPLLLARARAEKGADPLTRVDAVDARVLRARLDEAVRAAAARRAPSSPPERRALEAELGECVAPLAAALDDLARLADQVREAPDDVRLARWRAWAAGLGRVFARADGCWEASIPALAREARPSAPRTGLRGLWRRWRGGGGA